ncbi:hypothetical protein [Henriciella marina]|uniref:hypothetical protein n=1 Tax=Henriciella marina TaxID=453851 RepID=UPI0022B1D057|nr:hypothetical protein [Henriciella marina]
MSSPSPRQAAGCIAVCTLFLLSACASHPDGRGGRPEGPGPRQISGPVASPAALLFTGLDDNGDMIVSEAELHAGLDSAWPTFADGEHSTSTLSLDNWLERALGSSDSELSPIAFDSNIDGVISRREFDGRFAAVFERLDKDGNGELTRAELLFTPARARRQNVSQSGGRGREDRPRGRPQRQ